MSKRISMPLEEYNDWVVEVREARDLKARLSQSWGDLNQALYVMLNALHRQHNLQPFATEANNAQGAVRFDISDGRLTMKWTNDPDNTEGEEFLDDDTLEVSERHLGLDRKGDGGSRSLHSHLLDIEAQRNRSSAVLGTDQEEGGPDPWDEEFQ